MQKEKTVLLICLLILFADVLSLWQTVSLRFSENSFISDFAGIAILTSLGLLTLLLLWVNYALIRRISSKKRATG